MNYAIILAAGKGSRMKSDIPKVIYPFLNKPMINFIIEALENSYIDNIICVVGYKKEEVIKKINKELIYAHQKDINGTGGAIKAALDFINDDGYSIIIPGDMPLVDKEIIKKLYDNRSDLTICTNILDNPFGYGRILRNKKGNVIKIVEEKEASCKEKKIKEVNSGLYVIRNDLLKKYINNIKLKNNEYYFTDIVEILSKEININTIKYNDEYRLKGINDLYHLALLEDKIRENIIIKHMLNGVRIINPKTVYIGIDVKIKEGCVIYPNTIISGNSSIGYNCIIGPNSEIIGSIISDEVILRESVVEDSIILKKSQIGPYSHIRMNSIIGIKNKIGNFVEVKKSIIGSYTKASHLTYLGDTLCANNVNFGCGVVTANYDGINKNKTIIGNNAFIGCNSNLIAPIKIGNDCFIAAGSTINKNLNDFDFSIAREKQIIKEGYSSKFQPKKKDRE